MISEETGGKTRQFRRGTEHLKKGAVSAEFSGSDWEKNPQMEKSGLDCDHLGAAAQVTPTSSGLVGSEEDTIATSGSQPYDPWTNYLSPRPQFLRYKPSRLREIYLRRERELGGAEGDSGFDLGLLSEFQSPSSDETLPSSSSPSLLKQEDVSDLEPILDKKAYEGMGDEEDDTAEEERPSCCHLVWKVLLLLGILFFMTGYISSMHSFPTLSSSTKNQSFKDKYLKIQGAPQASAGNIGRNLEYSGTYMDTCINIGLDELATMENGIGGNNSNGICKLGKMEGEKLQEEGKSMVKDGSVFSVYEVKSNANPPVIVGGSEWSVHSGEDSQAETQMTMSKDSDFSADNKNQSDFLDMTEGGGDEYAVYGKESRHDNEMMAADDSCLVADKENLNADMVVVERENVGFICTDKVYDPQHGNRDTGNTISEEHMEDVMVETEIEETGGVTLMLNQPAKASQRQAISGYEEKNGSFGNGSGFTFYGMKVVITVLLALVFPITAIFCFRRLRELKTSVKDSSSSTPSCELALECDFEPPTTEKLKKEFDSLVNTGKFEVHGKYLPAVELLKEKLVDSLNRTDQSKELCLHETHPPTVELLGEFSVARLGSLKNRDSSLGKKTASTNIYHSQSPEISVRNSLPFSDQSLSEFSTTESTPRSKSDQEKLGRRQNNTRHRHGAVEAASTPLRRSSRIRNRATPP